MATSAPFLALSIQSYNWVHDEQIPNKGSSSSRADETTWPLPPTPRTLREKKKASTVGANTQALIWKTSNIYLIGRTEERCGCRKQKLDGWLDGEPRWLVMSMKGSSKNSAEREFQLFHSMRSPRVSPISINQRTIQSNGSLHATLILPERGRSNHLKAEEKTHRMKQAGGCCIVSETLIKAHWLLEYWTL